MPITINVVTTKQVSIGQIAYEAFFQSDRRSPLWEDVPEEHQERWEAAAEAVASHSKEILRQQGCRVEDGVYGWKDWPQSDPFFRDFIEKMAKAPKWEGP